MRNKVSTSGREVLSISLQSGAYRTIIDFCKARNLNRSKFIQDAILQSILETLQREVSNNGETI